ncbi:NTP pyrophosphatase (non-canonical NTP hydrolase) [Rhizobium paknamense]|uniref:NTP pyrophosphatase (Non-canonical NTP hydrolase) n=1 Tax=Rhizobium paknamense TaxID=1206817 RepID=A0ABU0IA30_9HYPH|nr:NTP pyrophosphatase (non-canonical NTP hydrolase) [Rhizobium paknamense]
MKRYSEPLCAMYGARRCSGRSRSKGMSEMELKQLLADETADLLGHILLFARHHDLDLGAAIARKWYFDPQTYDRL